MIATTAFVLITTFLVVMVSLTHGRPGRRFAYAARISTAAVFIVLIAYAAAAILDQIAKLVG